MKINGKIEKYFIDNFKLDIENDYQVKRISPSELFVSNRIDLVAKIKYIESLDLKYSTDFFYNLYKATIEAFSEGSFSEPGKDEKNSFDCYVKDFNKLIESINCYGFDLNKSLIPVSKNNVIIDGAHRTSICYYYNKDVDTITLPVEDKKYDLFFFKDRFLDKKYLDYLCLEYSLIKQNIHVFCLWPSCSLNIQNKIAEIISSNFNIIYEKNVTFSYDGLKNFMIQIYRNYDWIGNIQNKFSGVYNKLDNCYHDGNITRFIIIEENDNEKILNVKNEIRKLVGIGNHSIHSTDNYDETVQMLNIILNDNTINFFNKANPYKYKKFILDLKKYKNYLIEKNIPFDSILIDGSSILTLYGLRENNDIDVIVSDKFIDKVNSHYDIHNDELYLYGETVDNVLFNPDNYIVFDDLKFISIDLLKKKKKIRNSKKDKEDIALINSVLTKKNRFSIFRLGFKRNVKKFFSKLKKFIIFALKKIHLYNFIKKILKGK